MSLPGAQKIVLEGGGSVYMNSEDELWHSALVKRKGPMAMRGGKDSNGGGPKTAIRGVGGWIKRVNLVKMNAGKRIIKSKVLGSPEDPGNPGAVRDENSALEKINENFKSIHPLNQMNDHVKERLKDIAKQNAKKIAATIVELALYNTAFHHAKQGLKYATKRQKYTGPAVRYVSDVVLPDPLFGPIFGVLLRLKVPF